MSTFRAVRFTQRLVLGLAALVLGLATASQAAVAPPIQGRTFDLHTDSTHSYKATLLISHVTGSGPWSFTGTLQYANRPQWPVTGQMARQSTGGYRITFTARPVASYSESFEGAIRADNENDVNSPLFMAGQYFISQQVLQRTLIGTVTTTTVSGPRPFCAQSGPGGIIIL